MAEPAEPDQARAARAPVPSGRDYALLLLLGAIWGGSFLLIKLAIQTVPPVSVAAGRIVIGALFMGALLAVKGGRLPASRLLWAKLALMGTIGTVLPFALINWGETHIDSGLAAILMSAVPVLTIGFGHFLRSDEKITTGKALALALGGAGVLVLIGPDALKGLGSNLLGQLAVLGACACYAVTSLTARGIRGESAEVVTFCMLLIAAAAAVPLSLLLDRPWRLDPSLTSLLAVLGLGVLPTALGYIIVFRIIASAGAGFASFNNYLVPVYGVMWGMMLLGEEPQPRALLALLLIFVGVAAPRLLAARRPEAELEVSPAPPRAPR